MKVAFSIFAVCGFFASLLTHLTTFFGINPAKYVPWVWVLHLGIFIAMIPLLIAQRRKKAFRQDMLAALPHWARYAITGFFAYAFLNFALFFFLSEGGSSAIRDGKYVLHSHGQIIRELSEQEYELQRAYELRGFSGHWMLFYLLPAVYSLYRKD